MEIVLNEKKYELTKDYRNAFNLEELTARYDDYFEKYDFLLCDYAYGKLRIKGFFSKATEEANEDNIYESLDKYIKDYCAYDCKYFIITKK